MQLVPFNLQSNKTICPLRGSSVCIILGSLLDTFQLSLLQWMAAGVLGAFGLPVINSVVVASENALVPVQTHIKLCLLLWLKFFKTISLLLSVRRDLAGVEIY